MKRKIFRTQNNSNKKEKKKKKERNMTDRKMGSVYKIIL